MRHGYALRATTTALLLVIGAVLAHAHSPSSPCPDPLPAPSNLTTRTDHLTEGFEAGMPPSGWARIHMGSSTTWEANPTYKRSGAYSACVLYGPQGMHQDEYLVTPAIDLSGDRPAYLEFYEHQQYWSGFGEHHYIAVSTTSQTDPGAFTMIADWTPGTHTIVGFRGDPVTVALSAYAGEPVVYIAFRYSGTYADNWFIDDVRVYEAFDHDLAVHSLTPNGVQFTAGQALQPVVEVENKGIYAADCDLVVTIEAFGAEVYSQTQPLHLESEELVNIDFPDYIISSGTYYHLRAEAQLAGEDFPADNLRDATCDSYTQPHVPLGWFHTNAGCGPCSAPDFAFDGWLPGQGSEVALIRCHTWWPSGADILYLQNASQNQQLIYGYGADYTPHFWIDGVVDMVDDNTHYISAMVERKSVLSPGSIELNWRPADSTLVAALDLSEPLDPAGSYRLQVAVTEDSINFAGGNGHNLHSQALRRIFPLDLSGIPVDPGVGVQSRVVPIELAGNWQLPRLNATVFLQELNSRRIWQAATARLNSVTGRLSLDPQVCSVDVGETCTLRLMIDPSQIPVKGADVIVDFDESVLELQSIQRGSWITESGLAEYFHDFTTAGSGSAHFSLAFLDGACAGGGELALLEFKGLAVGATALTFTQEKVRDTNNTELGYTTSSGDSIYVTENLTAVDEPGDAAPLALRLLGGRPNPFNPSTLISYELPVAGAWQVAVFDARGRRVRTLVDAWQPAGRRESRWDGRDDRGAALGSGVYLVRVNGATGSVSGKLLLLK